MYAHFLTFNRCCFLLELNMMKTICIVVSTVLVSIVIVFEQCMMIKTCMDVANAIFDLP